MPFQYLLTNLLVEVPEAIGAIFLDGEGEAVEWVSQRQRDPYDLKVEGAYHTDLVVQATKFEPVERQNYDHYRK